MTDKPLTSTYFKEESVLLPLEDLFFTAPVQDIETVYNVLLRELEGGDLAFPIVAIHCEGREWNKVVRQSALEKAPTDNDKYFFVSCGNNRGRAALELGYTHISAIVLPRFHEGSAYCSKMRRWYVERQYRRDLGLQE